MSTDPAERNGGDSKRVSQSMGTVLVDAPSVSVDELSEELARTVPAISHTGSAGVRPGMPEPAAVVPGESSDDLFKRLILPEIEVMWRVALSITRNRADAEDVVQESLLRAYKAIDTFDGRYPRAWLLTILRNTERNRHRRRRPELLADPEMAEERGPATEPDAVERYAEDREFDQAVAQALLKLPENFREVLELIDVDGLAYQEAADVLGVPLGTVMSRLHRARRRIREQLKPLGYGPSTQQHVDVSANDTNANIDNAMGADSPAESRNSGEVAQ